MRRTAGGNVTSSMASSVAKGRRRPSAMRHAASEMPRSRSLCATMNSRRPIDIAALPQLFQQCEHLGLGLFRATGHGIDPLQHGRGNGRILADLACGSLADPIAGQCLGTFHGPIMGRRANGRGLGRIDHGRKQVGIRVGRSRSHARAQSQRMRGLCARTFTPSCCIQCANQQFDSLVDTRVFSRTFVQPKMQLFWRNVRVPGQSQRLQCRAQHACTPMSELVPWPRQNPGHLTVTCALYRLCVCGTGQAATIWLSVIIAC